MLAPHQQGCWCQAAAALSPDTSAASPWTLTEHRRSHLKKQKRQVSQFSSMFTDRLREKNSGITYIFTDVNRETHVWEFYMWLFPPVTAALQSVSVSATLQPSDNEQLPLLVCSSPIEDGGRAEVNTLSMHQKKGDFSDWSSDQQFYLECVAKF